MKLPAWFSRSKSPTAATATAKPPAPPTLEELIERREAARVEHVRLEAEVEESRRRFADQRDDASFAELEKAKREVDQHTELLRVVEQDVDAAADARLREERAALLRQLDELQTEVAADQARADQLIVAEVMALIGVVEARLRRLEHNQAHARRTTEVSSISRALGLSHAHVEFASHDIWPSNHLVARALLATTQGMPGDSPRARLVVQLVRDMERPA